MKKLPLLVLLLALSSCIRPVAARSPVFRAEPPTPQQIASCEGVRRAHNWWVVLGAFFGAGSGVSGVSTIASSDSNVQLGIGIASAASGALGTLFTALAGITADTYATENCQTVLQEAATK